MGGSSRWDPDEWKGYSSTVKSAPAATIFAKRSMHEDLDPLNIKVRESRDSAINPQSNAVIVGLDVTGSMGMIAEMIAKEGLGTLFTEILERQPVKDPHVMFMGIGDAYSDRAPLQVSQFECDVKSITSQLTNIWVEKGGGNNSTESYNLPWYFAAQHTSLDCFEKRGRKGYLFTLGDEMPPNPLKPEDIKKFIGDDITQPLDNKSLLEMVERSYHVFHLVVEQGNFCRYRGAEKVVDAWRDLMGQRVMRLTDYTKLSEVIVSTIQVIEGEDKATVAKSWSGDTSLVVANAINGLNTKVATRKSGVVRL